MSLITLSIVIRSIDMKNSCTVCLQKPTTGIFYSLIELNFVIVLCTLISILVIWRHHMTSEVFQLVNHPIKYHCHTYKAFGCLLSAFSALRRCGPLAPPLFLFLMSIIVKGKHVWINMTLHVIIATREHTVPPMFNMQISPPWSSTKMLLQYIQSLHSEIHEQKWHLDPYYNLCNDLIDRQLYSLEINLTKHHHMKNRSTIDE